MGKDMKYTFKLSPKFPGHVAAAKILDSLGRGEKRELLVAAILAYDENGRKPSKQSQPALTKNELKSMIAEMLDERLGRKERKPTNGSITPRKKEEPQNADPQDTDEKVQEDILKGLGGFMP